MKQSSGVTNSYTASSTTLNLLNIESFSAALTILEKTLIQTTRLIVQAKDDQSGWIPFASFSSENGKLKSVPDMKLTTQLESQLMKTLSSALSTKIYVKSPAIITTLLSKNLVLYLTEKLPTIFGRLF